MKFIVIIYFFLSSLVAFAGDKVTDVFTLDHQMSEMCEKKIKSNLRFENGISKIETSLKENTITITFDKDKTNTENIIEGFKKIGFNAMLVSPDSEPVVNVTKGNCSHCCNHASASGENNESGHCGNSNKPFENHCEKK